MLMQRWHSHFAIPAGETTMLSNEEVEEEEDDYYLMFLPKFWSATFMSQYGVISLLKNP